MIDIYGATAGIATSIASDVQSVLSGRVIPVTDYIENPIPT